MVLDKQIAYQKCILDVAALLVGLDGICIAECSCNMLALAVLDRRLIAQHLQALQRLWLPALCRWACHKLGSSLDIAPGCLQLCF